MTCYALIKHPIFETVSISVIIVNCFTLAMEDANNKKTNVDDLQGMDVFLFYCDKAFLWIYTCEMVLKILGLGFIRGPNTYLKDYWNCLDFVIVTSALFDYYTTM